LCTLVVASPGKQRSELRRDLSMIGAVQLLALAIALFTTCTARPAFLVYNVGEFEIEHANELTAEELGKATNPAFASAPWTGPVFVEARFPEDTKETMRIVNSATAGGPDIKDMPRYFYPWPSPGSDAAKHGVSVDDKHVRGSLRLAVERILHDHGLADADVMLLPISGKIDQGTVVLQRSDLSVVGILAEAI